MRVAAGMLLKGVVLVALSTLGAAGAQQSRPANPSGLPGDPAPDRDPAAERMALQVARGQNQERQKRIVSDADKLLALATQLKEEVGRSDKNTLSIEVIKKAEEIEKLAHSVKERMKG